MGKSYTKIPNQFLDITSINRPENVNCEYEVTRDAMYSYCANYPIYKGWNVKYEDNEEKLCFLLEKDGNRMSADILTSIKHPTNTIIEIITEKKRYYGKNKNGCEIIKAILNDKIECLNGEAVLPYLKLFSSVYYTIGNMMPFPVKGNLGGGGGDTALKKVAVLRKMFEKSCELSADGSNNKILEIYKISPVYERSPKKKISVDYPSAYMQWSKWVAEYNGEWEDFVENNFLQDIVNEQRLNYLEDKGYDIPKDTVENIIKWLQINSELIVQRNLRLISNNNEEFIQKYKKDIMKKLYKNCGLDYKQSLKK